MKVSLIFVVLAAIVFVQAAPHKMVESTVNSAAAAIKPQSATYGGKKALGKRGLVDVSNVKTKVCIPVKVKAKDVNIL